MLPLTCLSSWCTLPLLVPNTRTNPCSKNLVVDIAKVQILRGIVLLGGDLNARIIVLPDTIDTSNLYELLQVPDLVEIEQPNVVAKRQNRDANVGD